MDSKYTNEQIAENFDLWCEYFDTNAMMTEDEFDELTTDEKVAMLIAAFGPEEPVEAEDE
jgi:hypothetical protein